MKVWLDGHLVETHDQVLSVFDASVQHGVGLFETMFARDGRVMHIGRHVNRLIESARTLRLTDRLRTDPLAQAIEHVASQAGYERARVRLTVTGGNLNMIAERTASSHDPTLLIVAEPAVEYPATMFERGVFCTIADGGRNPFDPTAGHKTINYWPMIMALNQAHARGASEAIWLTSIGHLAGGSVSNVFLVKNDALRTPLARGENEPGSVPSPVLPGIARASIIDFAAQRSIAIEKRLLTLQELNEADEVFLTNSSWGVLPIVRIDDQIIGSGQVGPMTQALRADWLRSSE